MTELYPVLISKKLPIIQVFPRSTDTADYLVGLFVMPEMYGISRSSAVR